MQELHSFDKFSVSRSFGGDYYIKMDNGDEILILSPSGSDEHTRMSEWIESPDRAAGDFDEDIEDYYENEDYNE